MTTLGVERFLMGEVPLQVHLTPAVLEPFLTAAFATAVQECLDHEKPVGPTL